ncbi:MAG TPA: anti-sigma factor [Spirochaetia bacterium]|nr:anti-sigma factor [Spirochaetia bacterium]
MSIDGQEHEKMSHLLPSFVTGGLDPKEGAAVRRHLRRCSRCRKLIAEYRTAFDAIGHSVPLMEPPPSLRTRIIEELPAQPPLRLPAAVRFILDHPRAVIAASLAVLFLFAGSLWLNVSGISGAGTQVSGEARAAEDILAVMSGTEVAPKARAIIATGADQTSGVLYAFGLPVPPEGYAYQLWFTKDGIRRSGGVFRVTPEGHAVHHIRLAVPLSDFPTFGITVEPETGSDDPTGSKILENDDSRSPGTDGGQKTSGFRTNL